MTKLEKGRLGETIAAEFLQQHGYTILERNYRCGKSEIDLIAAKQSLLSFLEVKLRKDYRFGYPENHVKPAQITAIKRAAEHYLAQLNYRPAAIRFDIIAIKFDRTLHEIQHLKDVFY